MWINALKIAIIEKNTEKIEKLLDTTPDFSTMENLEEVLYLLKEGFEIVESLKHETSVAMKQMKKNIDFLESMQEHPKNSINIRA